MKNLIFILLVLTFQSCMTTNRIKSHCAEFAQLCVVSSNTKIEVRDTTIFQDDTLNIQIPRDTLIIAGITPIVQNKTIRENKHFESDYISADFQLKIDGDNVEWNIDAFLKDTSFQVAEKDTIFINDAIRSTTTENNIQLPHVKYIPGVYKIAFWIMIIEIILAIVWLVIKTKIGNLFNRFQKK